jgi:D-tyrosyl-tRNA(Tyr) deacylase
LESDDASTSDSSAVFAKRKFRAAESALAEELYNYFIEYARNKFDKSEHGVFGASMQVELVNDGPFTVILGDD